MDYPFLIHYLPRFLHVFLTVGSDYCILKWNHDLFANEFKSLSSTQLYSYTYFVILINAYISLFLLRTISNSLIYFLFTIIVYQLQFPLFSSISTIKQLYIFYSIEQKR